MKRLLRWTAVASFVLAAATTRPALAQDAPPRNGILTTATGLAAPSSAPSAGLTTSDPEELQQILRTISALDLTAHFHAARNIPTQTIGPLVLSGNADLSLHAHIARGPGQDSAVLDSLSVEGSGATLAGWAVQRASLDSQGQVSVKLSSWIPTVTIKQVEHQSDQIVLHTSWWMPNIKVKNDGTTTLLGFHVGHINPTMLAHWPPCLDDVERMMRSKPPTDGSAPTAPVAAAPTTSAAGPSMFDQLAGTLDWKLTGNIKNNSLSVSGKLVQGELDATVSGNATVDHGEIKTTGANTASVSVTVGAQNMGSAANGTDLGPSSVKLDGTYDLDVPLAHPDRLAVDFNGRANYSIQGSNMRLTIPDTNTKITVGNGDVTGATTVSLSEDLAKHILQINGNGTYSAQVNGAVHLDNVGPVKTLDTAGSITSTGSTTIGNGSVTWNGTLNGHEAEQKIGIVQILAGGVLGNANVEPGSTADLNVPNATASIELGLARNGNLKDLVPSFGGASGPGTLSGQLTVDGLSAHGNGVDTTVNGTASVGVTAPFGATLTPDGTLNFDPSKTNLTIPVHLDLKQGTEVSYRGPTGSTRFTLDRDGSTVQVTGKIGLDKDQNAVLQELDDADVNLSLGPATAVVGGHVFDMKAEKTIQLKGRIVFRKNGFDVYGNLTVGIHGDDRTPILSVNY
jgi:hypothetical protein